MDAHLEVGDLPAAAAAPGRHVVYDAVFDEYCLVREGGLDASPIIHCPWCGAGLPESKRDLWFAELAQRGLSADDPALDEAFRTDAWWASPQPAPSRAPGVSPERPLLRRPAPPGSPDAPDAAAL
jgi:Domain of unknown function (DUF6980)